MFSLDPILVLVVEYDVAVGGGVNEWAELRKGTSLEWEWERGRHPGRAELVGLVAG